MGRKSSKDLIRVGRIGKPHGVVGEVKVIPELRDAELFTEFSRLWIGPVHEDRREQHVESVRYQQSKFGMTALVKFGGVANRNDAESLRGNIVFALKAELPENELLAKRDLRGMRVLVDGTARGVVVQVTETAAHAILEIDEEGTTFFVPLVDAFVKEIDEGLGAIHLTLIPGLMDRPGDEN